MTKIYNNCPSKLDGEMLPLRFGIYPKQPHEGGLHKINKANCIE